MIIVIITKTIDYSLFSGSMQLYSTWIPEKNEDCNDQFVSQLHSFEGSYLGIDHYSTLPSHSLLLH